MNLEYVNKTQKEVWTMQRILTAFSKIEEGFKIPSPIALEDKLILEQMIKDKERTIRLEYMQD